MAGRLEAVKIGCLLVILDKTKELCQVRVTADLDKIDKDQDEFPINLLENIMASVALQIVSKPLPGADMAMIMGNMKDAAALWRSAGAEVKVYTVSVGEIGNLVFTAHWGSYEAYGKSLDMMVGEQSVQALMAKINASGTAEWVRSNLVREMPI
jgi:hypothetical protein